LSDCFGEFGTPGLRAPKQRHFCPVSLPVCGLRRLCPIHDFAFARHSPSRTRTAAPVVPGSDGIPEGLSSFIGRSPTGEEALKPRVTAHFRRIRFPIARFGMAGATSNEAIR